GPTLRQHEMDVLAFIKARLKPKSRRNVDKRAAKPAEKSVPPAEGAGEEAPKTPELEPASS
ncbi:MAG TPA: hypothetical protein VK542_04290, partial [Gemmatimonadaceae bacterium]|nr:hypothetical protein [Gemmatimonadaceae bacterium]